MLTCPYQHVLIELRRLLEKFKIFTAFYHLSELRSREDLITTIIDHLDYGMYVERLNPILEEGT